jgi:hypothetical protein
MNRYKIKIDMNTELTIGDLQDIELVLTEASAWGLRVEVEETAKQYIEEGQHPVDAYHFAYNEWVK